MPNGLPLDQFRDRVAGTVERMIKVLRDHASAVA
jgi:hypothetical protein